MNATVGEDGGDRRCVLGRKIAELENQLSACRLAAAERDLVLRARSRGVSMLNSLWAKVSNVFGRLTCNHGELRDECGRARERMRGVRIVNEQLLCDERRMRSCLDELTAAFDRLEAATATLRDETRRLDAQTKDAEEENLVLRDRQKRVESKLTAAASRATDAERRETEMAAACVGLERRAHAERAKRDCIIAAKADAVAEHERVAGSVCADVVAARDRLEEVTTAIAAAERDLTEERMRCEAVALECATMQQKADELQKLRDRDERCANEERGCLRSDAERLRAELVAANRRLSDAIAENDRLGHNSEERAVAAEVLDAEVEAHRLALERAVQEAELTEQKLAGERKQRANETALFSRKLLFKEQELREMRLLIEDRERQMTRLRTRIADVAERISDM